MRINLGPLFLGALLVVGGFLLARGPGLVTPAQAGVASLPDANQWVVTTSAENPSRIFVWHTNSGVLKSVSVHSCDLTGGTVTSRQIEAGPEAGQGAGR